MLCPRPETELLVEKAVEYLNGRNLKTLDLCTGSGCIAAALKSRGANVFASDIDDAALKTARENLTKLGVEVIKSDMLDGVGGGYELIVSNPPYIKSKDLASLSEEVKNEPLVALDGGEDGLDFYLKIADGLKGVLANGGALFMEIGYDIGESAAEIFRPLFESVRLEKDYSDLDRFLICTGYVGGEKKEIGE